MLGTPWKLVTGMCGHIDSLLSTRSHPMTPFFNYWQPIFDNCSPNDPFLTTFRQNFQSFSNFLSKMCPNLFLPWKLTKICQIISLFIFVAFSLNGLLFWRKICHQRIPSFELLSEHPHHFQRWVPTRVHSHIDRMHGWALRCWTL